MRRNATPARLREPAAGAARGGGGALPPTGAIQHIRDNLYKIPGAGGNTTVFIRDDGVVLVDTKLANNGEAILNQVKTVTDKPVTMIINTHVHPDHNGSNDYFKTARPTVEVVPTRTPRSGSRRTRKPIPATIPDLTFTDTMRLGKGKDRIDIYYFGAGHTDGDAFIVFTAVRAMCIGDLMAWNMAPLIDPATGGSIVALADTLEKAEKGIKNVDLVIEGHGNVNTWEGMEAYTEFMRGLLKAAKDGLDEGRPPPRRSITLEKNPKFAVFLTEERLKDLEYGDTPKNRRTDQSQRCVSGASRGAGDHVFRAGAVNRTREGQCAGASAARWRCGWWTGRGPGSANPGGAPAPSAPSPGNGQ